MLAANSKKLHPISSGGVVALGIAGGVGYGVYKMAFDARQWMIANDRPKAPWEREPGEPRG